MCSLKFAEIPVVFLSPEDGDVFLPNFGEYDHADIAKLTDAGPRCISILLNSNGFTLCSIFYETKKMPFHTKLLCSICRCLCSRQRSMKPWECLQENRSSSMRYVSYPGRGDCQIVKMTGLFLQDATDLICIIKSWNGFVHFVTFTSFQLFERKVLFF